jgi:DNA-directed RNA polymerase specialized sigma24 family protein
MNGNGLAITEAREQDALHAIVLQAFILPAAFRKVFLLCDIQGFTINEAATILEISAAAVSARLDRARRLLAARIRTHDGEFLRHQS